MCTFNDSILLFCPKHFCFSNLSSFHFYITSEIKELLSGVSFHFGMRLSSPDRISPSRGRETLLEVEKML